MVEGGGQATMQRFATGLLVVMAIIFVLSRYGLAYPGWGWLGWVEAFSEAAMVGALADWFAVTALFRHPLGIPIPHTAIIPSNKDRIGLVLGEFVQTNFLSSEVLGAKIAELQPSKRIQSWLCDAQSSRKASQSLVAIGADLIKALDDSDVRAFLRENLNEARKEIHIGGGLAVLVRAFLHGDRYHHVLNEGLQLAERLLILHQDFLREALRKELPWYVPNFIHDKVYTDTIQRVRDTIHAINSDPAHPARAAFFDYVQRLTEALRSSPQAEARCQEIVGWLFESADVAAYARGVWVELRASLQEALSAGSPRAAEGLQRALNALGRALAADPQVSDKLDAAVLHTARKLADEYQDQIAGLIADTVRRWDSETIVEKIEQHVGRDLQYIRINGTIVGGLVGLVIHACSVLLP